MRISQGGAYLFATILLLPWARAASSSQQESTLGMTLVEIPTSPKPTVGVVQVLPNGPAARAGVLPGDIILGVDNFPVFSAGDLTQWVERRTSREGVTLTILRQDWFGQYQQMPVRVLLPPSAAGSAPPSTSGAVKPGRPTADWLGVKFSLKTQPVKVLFNDYHTCYAVAPGDWFVYGHRKEGDAVDVGGPDRIAVSWSASGVAGSMRQSLPHYATPETEIHFSLSGGFTGQRIHVTYGEPIQDEFGYIWLPFVKEDTKPPFRGVVIYRVFPVPNDPMGYILIARWIQTPKQLWEQKGALALMVGLSIRCNVQLRASPDGPSRPRSDDDKQESTYNQQLGIEYAHNPDTGEIYWMNHASDWKETGPQGPGYYIRSGNEWKKLEQGLGR